MNPATPSVLEECVAAVAGIPYRSCRQVGVIVVAQEAGTEASVVRLVGGVDFAGTEMTGRRALGEENLKSHHETQSWPLKRYYSNLRDCGVDQLYVPDEVGRDGVGQSANGGHASSNMLECRELSIEQLICLSDRGLEANPISSRG